MDHINDWPGPNHRIVKSKSRLFLDSLIIFFYDLFMISL